MSDIHQDDSKDSENGRSKENQDDGNSKTNDDPESKGSVSKQVQTDSLSIDLSTQKSILVNQNRDGGNFVSLSGSQGQSIDIEIHSSDSGVYNFYRTHVKNDNLAKADAFLYMIIPPDGGYAWVILGAAFLCQAIVDGIIFSIGILLPHIASEMSLSNKETALVASTQLGIYCFTAPLGSAFINKLGFRFVAVTGSITASAAIFLASFSQGISMLVFFYGIIAGPAMGLTGVSSSLIINYYFERLRAVVGGVASSGSGVGVICLSIFNVEIVDKFGWRVAVRLHVILLLIAGLLVCTYREVKPIKIGQLVKSITEEDSDEETVISTELASDKYSTFTISDLLKSTSSTVASGRNVEFRKNSETEKLAIQDFCPWCFQKSPLSVIDENRLVIKHDPLDKDDIFYDGPPEYSPSNANQIGELKRDFFVNKEEMVRSVSYNLSVIRRPSRTLSEEEKYEWIPKKIKSAFYALFDLQLLKISEFWLLLLASFFFPMGFNIPFVYSTERAQIDAKYANLLPVVIGLTNIIFRVTMGFVAYKINFHTAYLAGAGMILGGLTTLLSGFVGQKSEAFQFAFAFCFGIAAASYSALRAIIYVKVLGLERLTNAFGLTTMVMGVGVFFGTNFAGYLNDLFLDFSQSFVFSGACMTIAGLAKVSIPKYVEYRRRIEANKVKRKVRFAKGILRKKWWQKCFS